MDQGDGTFDCIPPSAVGCNVLDVADDGVANMSTVGTACSFEHFGQEVTGLCFGAAPGAIACVETCAPDDGSAFPGYNETPCGNPNSTCQATGAIGDPATAGVCIPADTFTSAADCPSGTHPVDQGDGTFDCIPPSAVGCNVSDALDDGVANMSNLGSACSFDHFGQTVSGVCFGAAAGALSLVLRHVHQMMARRIQDTTRHHVTTRTAPVRQLAQLVTQPPWCMYSSGYLYRAFGLSKWYPCNRPG